MLVNGKRDCSDNSVFDCFDINYIDRNILQYSSSINGTLWLLRAGLPWILACYLTNTG
jgi:hypothetical protein